MIYEKIVSEFETNNAEGIFSECDSAKFDAGMKFWEVD